MKTKEEIETRVLEIKNVMPLIENDLAEESDHRNYQDLQDDLNTLYIELRLLEWVLTSAVEPIR